MTLSRVGEPEVAWAAADRSVAAAEAAERPLLAAVSAYRLGYVLIGLKRAAQAEYVLLGTADALANSPRRLKPPALSVRGGLHLAAASAAASRFDRAATDRHINVARKIADQIGQDRNDFWSAFGPTNVTTHEVSAAVTFGDAKLALSRGEPYVPSMCPVLRRVSRRSVPRSRSPGVVRCCRARLRSAHTSATGGRRRTWAHGRG